MSEPIVTINGVPMSKKIKEHIKRNKTHYIWGSVLVIAVTATGVFAYKLGTKTVPVEIAMGAKQINILSKDNVLMQVVIKPGNSGDVLWDPINKVAYLSKNEASKALGVSRYILKQMIEEGKIVELVDGYQGTAPVAA
ncbi:MAG: hypothetical protein ACWGQW_13830 [bacterium]